jgi:hypothetical protein
MRFLLAFDGRILDVVVDAEEIWMNGSWARRRAD